MLVAVIKTSGEIESRDIDGTLESMQALVGGYIEALDLTGDSTMWVNEEGLLLDLPYNHTATMFAGNWYNDTYIVGDVFITGGADENGKTLPIREDYLEALLRAGKEIMADF